ncbi:hypothetical protein GCM10017687_79510 [Streptomyces echinatus]
MGGGGDVVRAEGDQAPAQSGMHPGQPQAREVRLQGVSHEGVAEADRTRPRLGEKPGGHAGVQGVEELLGIAVRGLHQEGDRGLASGDGCEPQSGRDGRCEQGEPAPQYVLDPLRDPGQGLLLALAGHQEGTLTEVEGVCPRPVRPGPPRPAR